MEFIRQFHTYSIEVVSKPTIFPIVEVAVTLFLESWYYQRCYETETHTYHTLLVKASYLLGFEALIISYDIET